MFLFTDSFSADGYLLPLDVLDMIRGIIGKGEDTAGFIGHRIMTAASDYFAEVLPPFFAALQRYAQSSRYSLHTPGHMGGIAFLRSPPGKLFYDFYGENLFRSDLSVSVPELGSLLEHSGVVGLAEANAARVFGADSSFFVTNGTSTSNKIAYQHCVASHDLVLLDRNSHKSSMQ